MLLAVEWASMQNHGTHHGLFDGLLSLFSAQDLIHLHLLVLVLQTQGCAGQIGQGACCYYQELTVWSSQGRDSEHGFSSAGCSPSYSPQRTCTMSGLSVFEAPPVLT